MIDGVRRWTSESIGCRRSLATATVGDEPAIDVPFGPLAHDVSPLLPQITSNPGETTLGSSIPRRAPRGRRAQPETGGCATRARSTQPTCAAAHAGSPPKQSTIGLAVPSRAPMAQGARPIVQTATCSKSRRAISVQSNSRVHVCRDQPYASGVFERTKRRSSRNCSSTLAKPLALRWPNNPATPSSAYLSGLFPTVEGATCANSATSR